MTAGESSSRWAARVTISTVRSYSGFAVPSMIPGISRNCRRTSSTTSNADRPTARIKNAETRKGTAPPMRRPMKMRGRFTWIPTRSSPTAPPAASA